ncbi:cellulose binding domain-containing protein [Polymorphospora rubra]|uniref:cellulose binding domain-containing protein n=1 Tax=Polymorphospora rubra TaxID=338584 RepID=UPI0033E3E6D6
MPVPGSHGVPAAVGVQVDRSPDAEGAAAELGDDRRDFLAKTLGGTGPNPTPTPSVPPTPTTPPPSPGQLACAAGYAVTGQWQDGFRGEVTVRAGSRTISGWTVTWTYADGQTITQSWGATVTGSGANVTAANAAWNGGLAAGAVTSFGFIGSAGATNGSPTLSCQAR